MMPARFMTCAAALAVLTIAGCAPRAADERSALRTHIDELITREPYIGPRAAVSVSRDPGFEQSNLAIVVLTAPTGGWVLTLDEADVRNGEAILLLTLEQPGPDEVVTMALVTHRAEFRSSRDSFHTAKAYIRLTTRGEEGRPGLYRYAAEG
jgi:hypothetical protein